MIKERVTGQHVQAPETLNEGAKKKKSMPLLRAMRPKQWTKNFVAFAPLLFAAKANDLHLLLDECMCVAAFCLLSSSIYIINDILDREADKKHPTKCRRPIAAGEISIATAWTMAAILAPSALILSFLVRPALTLVLIAYLLLTVAYSYVLKHVSILDVLSIAAGFLLRAVAGAVAVHVPMSGWFLLCTGLGAIYLALEKRRNELAVLANQADSHRKALQGYTAQLLDRMESLILPSLLTSYVFYSFQSVHGQWMMLTLPFVIYGLMRYQQLSSEKNANTGTPEEVLLKDKPIQITILLWLFTSALVVYGGIQYLAHTIVVFADSLKH